MDANGVRIYKFNVKMEDSDIILNEHHKEEFPPAHTAEHLLNKLLVRLFGCDRSKNDHIDRKKSKMNFLFDHKHTRQEEEFPPAHTAEHLLNQLMVRLFGCERSRNAHIERKKSKMTFVVDHKPTRQEEKEIETEMIPSCSYG